jgi:cytochrome c biogenesis protein CcdA
MFIMTTIQTQRPTRSTCPLLSRLNRVRWPPFIPALTTGVLVGLCTVPCSGAIYLGVLGLLATRTTYAEGLAYLVLYNGIFVLPLVAMLALASSRKYSTRWPLAAPPPERVEVRTWDRCR